MRDVQALIDKYGLHSSIAWIGPRYGQAKAACFHHATAFVLTSYSEGLPLAALEALSFGLPAVLTPECHLPKAFEAGAALLAEPTQESIARTLFELFSLDQTQLTAMGERGCQLVRTSFAWESVAERMIEVYRWLVAPQLHSMPADVRTD